MKFKNLLFALVITSSFISCSKDATTPAPLNIAAKTMNDTSYGVNALQKMDIYLPANRSTATTKVIILIHGGGWTSGDKSDFISLGLIDTLKKRLPDYAIVNINYRLAAFPSSNPFPTQELDTKAAVDFIYGNRSNYLISDKFVLLGASAGGHLALLEAYKYHSPVNIKAVVDLYGPTDMADMYNNPGSYPPSLIAALLSGTPTTNPTLYQQSSSINFVNASSCPTIVLQGALDPLVNPTTQSVALVTKLTAATVINQYVLYPLVAHGPWDVATSSDAYDKIQAFLKANVH